MKKIIIRVEENSVAEKYGLKEGWEVVSINGNRNFDIIDYMMETAETSFNITIKDESGNEKSILIHNPEWSPVGIGFENMTIDKPKLCKNKCVFCFMDQMPKGLRKTLYFKDDDYRLSFTCGNYVTLTNVSDEELDRIISYKLSPMNISVHTTDPELRYSMMKNTQSKNILAQLNKLQDGGIRLNIQLVLCPGYNDGAALETTLTDMLTFLPSLNSLSIVPVGLTKYREGLALLQPFDKAGAEKVIDTIEEFRNIAHEKSGAYLFHASDEFFTLAQRDFPPDAYYEDYSQYENGVGMARSFIDEIDEALADTKINNNIHATIITGELGYPILKGAADKIQRKFPDIILETVAIKNEFFGGHVTASGLVCGSDIIKQMKDQNHATTFIIPSNMLKEDDDVFLDDMTVKEIEDSCHVKCIISPFSGRGLFDTLKNMK